MQQTEKVSFYLKELMESFSEAISEASRDLEASYSKDEYASLPFIYRIPKMEVEIGINISYSQNKKKFLLISNKKESQEESLNSTLKFEYVALPKDSSAGILSPLKSLGKYRIWQKSKKEEITDEKLYLTASGKHLNMGPIETRLIQTTFEIFQIYPREKQEENGIEPTIQVVIKSNSSSNWYIEYKKDANQNYLIDAGLEQLFFLGAPALSATFVLEYKNQKNGNDGVAFKLKETEGTNEEIYIKLNKHENVFLGKGRSGRCWFFLENL